MHKKIYLFMSLLVLPVSVLRAQEAESEDVYRKPSCCVSLPLYGDVVGTTCDSRVAFVGGISAAQIAQCCSGSSGGSTAAGTCAATANTLALRDASGSILFNDIGVGVEAAIKAPSATEFYAGNNVGPAATICSTTRGPAGGASCTAVGTACLPNNTGVGNTAYGFAALNSNVAGASNTAVGFAALSKNVSGDNNTVLGAGALGFNDTGDFNTAIGAEACSANPMSFCTAVGGRALFLSAGDNNTAIGYNAVASAGTRANCVAVGVNTVIRSDNAIAIGSGATVPTASASAIAIGSGAGVGGTGGVNSILIGGGTQALGDNAIAIGSGLTPPGNTIYIGGDGVSYTRFVAKGIYDGDSIGTGFAVASNSSGTLSINLTKFFANGIVGVTTDVNDAIPVLIDSAGQLGTLSSSKRYKKDIQSLGDESSDIMKLRPVTFRYKTHPDTARRQYGLIAEEVNEVYPDLVIRNKESEIETVAYQHLPILTLSEVQKQHKKIEQLESHAQSQKSKIKSLQAEIENYKSAFNNLAQRLVSLQSRI